MAAELLSRLRSLGVVLSVNAEGRLHYDAPAGVLGADLLAEMRAQRDELLAVVGSIGERAAITEHDGALGPDEDEAPALGENEPAKSPTPMQPMCGVICPWCGSNANLIVESGGLRCDYCGRVAWLFEGESIVRADVHLLDLNCFLMA